MCLLACGFVYVCSQVCVFVCVKGITPAKFSLILMTGHLGRQALVVSWDSLLLTERGEKGTKLTLAFHADSRWTANQVFIFAVIVEPV